MLRWRGANLRSQKELNVFSHFCPFCPFWAKSCHPNMVEYFPCRCCSNLFDPPNWLVLVPGKPTRYGLGGAGSIPAELRGPDGRCSIIYVQIQIFHVFSMWCGPIPTMWMKAWHVPIHPARHRGAARCKKLGTKRMCRTWGSSLCFVSAFVAHSAPVALCGIVGLFTLDLKSGLKVWKTNRITFSDFEVQTRKSKLNRNLLPILL